MQHVHPLSRVRRGAWKDHLCSSTLVKRGPRGETGSQTQGAGHCSVLLPPGPWEGPLRGKCSTACPPPPPQCNEVNHASQQTLRQPPPWGEAEWPDCPEGASLGAVHCSSQWGAGRADGTSLAGKVSAWSEIWGKWNSKLLCPVWVLGTKSILNIIVFFFLQRHCLYFYKLKLNRISMPTTLGWVRFLTYFHGHKSKGKGFYFVFFFPPTSYEAGRKSSRAQWAKTPQHTFNSSLCPGQLLKSASKPERGVKPELEVGMKVALLIPRNCTYQHKPGLYFVMKIQSVFKIVKSLVLSISDHKQEKPGITKATKQPPLLLPLTTTHKAMAQKQGLWNAEK